MTPIKPKYPIYWILWDDAEGESGWSEEPIAPLTPTLATTIGFLIRDEPNYVLVADSYFSGSRVIGGTNKIPRKMIVEMQEVQLSKKRENVKKAVKEASVPEGTTN